MSRIWLADWPYPDTPPYWQYIAAIYCPSSGSLKKLLIENVFSVQLTRKQKGGNFPELDRTLFWNSVTVVTPITPLKSLPSQKKLRWLKKGVYLFGIIYQSHKSGVVFRLFTTTGSNSLLVGI